MYAGDQSGRFAHANSLLRDKDRSSIDQHAAQVFLPLTTPRERVEPAY